MLCHISYAANASGEAFNDAILCKILFLEAKTFSFTQILMLKIWAKRGGYQLQKGQKLLLQMKKSTEKGNPSGNCNFGSFQDLYRSGRPRVTYQTDDHLIKRMVVRSPTSSSKKLDLF